MLNRALKALGKSLVIVTGVGYGVIKAMDALANEGETASKGSSGEPAAPDPTVERLGGVEQRLIRLEQSLQALTVSQEHLITRAELDQAMQRLSGDINADIEQRFEVQNRSVQSLRSMIARTDELLEQVIENIEATSLTA